MVMTRSTAISTIVVGSIELTFAIITVICGAISSKKLSDSDQAATSAGLWSLFVSIVLRWRSPALNVSVIFSLTSTSSSWYLLEFKTTSVHAWIYSLRRAVFEVFSLLHWAASLYSVCRIIPCLRPRLLFTASDYGHYLWPLGSAGTRNYFAQQAEVILRARVNASLTMTSNVRRLVHAVWSNPKGQR